MKKLLVLVLIGFTMVCLVYAGGTELIIDQEIIEKVISNLTEDLKHLAPFTDFYGLTWSAVMYARHAVFAKELGDDYNCVDAAIAKQREHIMEITRKALKNPQALQISYLSLRDFAIEKAIQNGIADKIKNELKIMLPYFDGTLDPQIAEACERRRVAWDDYVFGVDVDASELSALERSLKDKYGLTNKNFNYYEWPLRRLMEGGQELMNMWAWIIDDAITSLGAVTIKNK